MPEPARPPLRVHVVAHTHWDREWYRTAEEFRLGLVDLVDEVLDGAAVSQFLLDGQAIVLLDYLAARPDREDAVRASLVVGRIEAGPWFVLGDNLIPSGEALVRNLLLGRATIERMGGTVPSVLYCPDAFGHPAVLPQLAAGFGASVCIVWRGYGGAPWPAGDVARWTAADGSAVLLYHLAPDGYEVGSSLPADPAAADARWQRLRSTLGPRAALGVILLPNGADHHAVQLERSAALEALRLVAAPDTVTDGGLQRFADALTARAAGHRIAGVTGELRHSADYAWSLQGTFGSRAGQKRANAHGERLLLHHVEPLSALAWWHDGRSRRHEIDALWRDLLACHPHDTLCGCSIDAVAAAMDHRLDVVQRAGTLAAQRARLARLDHDASAARARVNDWRPVVVLWNPVPYQRGGIAELELDEPVAVVAVGPHSASAPVRAVRARRWQLGGGDIVTQELSSEMVHVREESPRHYPLNRLVRRRRVLAWVPQVEALGLATLSLSKGRPAASPLLNRVMVSPDALDNGRCRAWVDESGRLCLSAEGTATLRDVLALEVRGERGDLYTPSGIPGTRVLGTIVQHRLVERGPLRGTLRLILRAVVPPREVTSANGMTARRRAAAITAKVDVQLTAGSAAVVLLVRGINVAEDCRIRVVVRTGIRDPAVLADAAFGAVARRAVPPDESLQLGAAQEASLPTAPLHRFVTLSDGARAITLVSDGLAEYEAGSDGAVAVTLVRAVGDLSRNDLPERPGHAGWPAPTPDAQCKGAFEGRFALLAHAPTSDVSRIAVQRAVEALLLPIVGDTWSSALQPPAAVSGPRLVGEGLAFSTCKESVDGRSLVVRCVNILDRTVRGSCQLAGVAEASLARLDEMPLGALVVRDGEVEFDAPPHATITILLRR